jgi:hypothetical protein
LLLCESRILKQKIQRRWSDWLAGVDWYNLQRWVRG